MAINKPKLVVYSSLFPSLVQPNAGIFIRERMFRAGKHLPIVVVSPVPWFPFQGIIRKWKPYFRPQPEKLEEQGGIKIYHPRFFSVPGLFKSWDGFFMALGSVLTLIRIRKEYCFDIIDAHFAYPDGFAATLLGKWFRVPVTITLRGTEIPLSKMPGRKKRILLALQLAARIFSVSDSFRQHVISLGAGASKILVVGNGVDIDKFTAVDKLAARNQLDIPVDSKVIVSIGGLVERKGFHRVIEVLPDLVESRPELIYLIVGGAGPEGNIRDRLERQVQHLRLEKNVRFLGALPSEQLKIPLSAADVFVLATANEGWANVFLEALACGLPVVTTDVGGNREVICDETLGTVIPFGDPGQLQKAIADALSKDWNKEKIIQYARDNAWDERVTILVREFKKLLYSENERKLR